MTQDPLIERQVPGNHSFRLVTQNIFGSLFNQSATQFDIIEQPDNVLCKTLFVFHIVQERAISCYLGKRSAGAANNRTSTVLRFDDRPAKSLEA
jgi:hypothetical protein